MVNGLGSGLRKCILRFAWHDGVLRRIGRAPGSVLRVKGHEVALSSDFERGALGGNDDGLVSRVA